MPHLPPRIVDVRASCAPAHGAIDSRHEVRQRERIGLVIRAKVPSQVVTHGQRGEARVGEAQRRRDGQEGLQAAEIERDVPRRVGLIGRVAVVQHDSVDGDAPNMHRGGR